MKKYIIPGLIIVLLLIGVAVYFGFFAKPQASQPEYHVHADIAVFVNGQKLNFSQQKYMNIETCGKPGEAEQDANADLTTLAGMKMVIHLHDLNGNSIHIHNANATLSMLFKGIGFDLTPTCLVDDQGRQYCNSNNGKLRVFVNDAEITDFVNYKPQDLDKILVTYGSDSDAIIRDQFTTVTNEACIYSEKCPVPSGFVLTPESCGK